jgi:hypothetical protein
MSGLYIPLSRGEVEAVQFAGTIIGVCCAMDK